MSIQLPITLLDLHDAILAEVADSVPSANATFVYAVQWREGKTFDLAKSAVKVHRSRLRRLGIDIAKPYAGEIISIRDSR
ncbi:phage/plasmid replication protein [Pseudomonas oleovorans]|uniref:phage/plasmid replication domain-containing protein n=1 Tax=Ectopseudomonas oleovorans TaxID=301 RepID=UPI000E6AC8B2